MLIMGMVELFVKIYFVGGLRGGLCGCSFGGLKKFYAGGLSFGGLKKFYIKVTHAGGFQQVANDLV